MRVFAYLRASTAEQDARRAEQELREFATSHKKDIYRIFSENITGTKSDRPELNKLLLSLSKNDVILIESIDRLTRMVDEDYQRMRRKIADIGAHIVAVDIPNTHQIFNTNKNNDCTIESVNNLITNLVLDLSAVFARRDYEQRRKRTMQGIAKAKQEGKFKGRPIDKEKREHIEILLKANATYKFIQEKTGYAPATIAKVSKALKNQS